VKLSQKVFLFTEKALSDWDPNYSYDLCLPGLRTVHQRGALRATGLEASCPGYRHSSNTRGTFLHLVLHLVCLWIN